MLDVRLLHDFTMLRVPHNHLLTAITLIALILSSSRPTSPFPVASAFDLSRPLAGDAPSTLAGTWLGYADASPEPQMRVVYSPSGWLTKTYLGHRPTSQRCRYRRLSNDLVDTKCAERGMRIHWIDANTIEFKVADGKTRQESIDIIYTLTFRRCPPHTQPN